MKASTVNGTTVKLLASGGPVSGTVITGADGKSIQFTPSSLLSSFSLYTISLDGSIEDIAGNTLGNTFQSSFTTLDIAPPVITGIDPSDNAGGVEINSVITITFSEAIDSVKFSSQNIEVKAGSSPVNGTFLFNETKNILTFTSSSPFNENSTYNVSLSGYEDLAGNVQTEIFSSIFHTIDTISPSITLVPPAQGTTLIEGTNVTVNVQINSSPDIDKVYFFLDGVTKKTDAVSPFTYTFTTPLIANIGRTTFLVEALAVDHAGNQSTRENLLFTLLPDNPPQVTLTGPGDPNVYPGNTISLSVSATDDVLLNKVTLTGSGGTFNFSDVSNISQKTFSKNYNILLPADLLPGTSINFIATVLDSKGSSVSGNTVNLNVPDDQNPPVVNITSPANGSEFNHKDVITITADATDDIGMKEVNFYLDGQLLNKDIQAPYSSSYTVPPLENDKVSIIKAEAIDLAGKISFSEVEVTLKKLFDETAR